MGSDGKAVAIKFLLFSMATISLNLVASTFIILYIIDLVDFAGLSLVISVSFIVSALTDYPTGVLADWLGHKWVLAIGYSFYALGSLLLVFAPGSNNPLRYLIITYIIFALASGQASGALESWFDNAYKKVATLDDPKKEIYREFMGKNSMLVQYSGSLAFLIGGILASVVGPGGRQLVFLVQAIGLGVISVGFLLYLETEETEEEKEEKSYLQLMKEGVAFAFSSKMMGFVVSSSVLVMAMIIVWANLVLFVVYFQYTGSDATAGIFRWMIWIAGATLASYAGKLSKKLSVKPWIPRLNLLFVIIHFGLAAVVFSFIPLPEPPEFTPIGAILVFLLFVTGGFFLSAYFNLTQKWRLEIIPDHLRNSFYSLIPSLALLVGAILVYFIGNIITNLGLVFGVLAISSVGIIGVILEFIAIGFYEPSEEEIEDSEVYNVYYVDAYDSLIYRIPKDWRFAKKVELIWDQLLEVAHQDEKISEDEMQLLDHIMIHLKDYGEILEKALEDEIITEEEKLELVVARAKLLQTVEEKAKDDNMITADEERILDKLRYIIQQIQEDHET